MKKNNVKENNDFDIDLILPQGAFLKNKARAIKREKIKKRKRIIKSLLKLIKSILPTVIVLILFITLVIFNYKLKQRGIQGCLENGYSYEYCIVHS